MDHKLSIPVGIIIAREAIDHPWADHVWRPVKLVLEAPPGIEWKELANGEGWVHYLVTTAAIELHRKDTAGYQFNLTGREPMVYVVLRENDTPDDPPMTVHLVTASPYEAQDYLDSGEEIVESLPMPDRLTALIERYVAEHHKEEKFRKRRRDKLDVEEHKFGQEPIVVLRERMKREGGDDG